MLCTQRDKKKRLVIILASKHNDTEVQRNEISFFGNSYFCSSEVECERKCKEWQIIMQACVKRLEVKHKRTRL